MELEELKDLTTVKLCKDCLQMYRFKRPHVYEFERDETKKVYYQTWECPACKQFEDTIRDYEVQKHYCKHCNIESSLVVMTEEHPGRIVKTNQFDMNYIWCKKYERYTRPEHIGCD